MKTHYDEKFKEMIIDKYNKGTKVSVLAKDFEIAESTIYKWRSQVGKVNTNNEEIIDYEKEYKKLLKEKNEVVKENYEIQGEMEALKKCIAIFSKK